MKAAEKIWSDFEKEGQAYNRCLQAAWQLYLTTGNNSYIKDMESALMQSFQGSSPRRALSNLTLALQVSPKMSKKFLKNLRPYVEEYKKQLNQMLEANPYGVNVYGTGWGSNGSIISQGINCYWANKYFPDIVTRDDILRSANFIFGCHPFSNLSFVMGVGVKPKNVAYGNNRADFSFIAGGVVPGLLLLQPDYIENKDDWPFFWGQNECTIAQNASYLLFGNILSQMKE